MNKKLLVLASTSVYRKELLGRLGLAFETHSPETDETALPGESPATTAKRLAQAKAQTGQTRFPGALIIGSDQVAELDGQPLGKPGDHANATRQLRALRGRSVVFHTALCLLDSQSGRTQLAVVPTSVGFRHFSDQQIEHYLAREQPYQCAGSAKAEGLGIALIEFIRGDDPTALIGLPLITLTSMLNNEGVEVLG